MRENGFTLVEMLVVLAIGTMLISGVSLAIGSFSPALERVKKNEEQSVYAQDMKSLSGLLSAARFQDTDDENLTASPTEIEFLARLPLSANRKGLYLQRLKIVSDEAQMSLQLDIPELRENIPPSYFLKSSKSISISAEYRQTSSAQKRELEKITINAADKKGQRQQITARPKVSIEAACEFDPISQGCRQ